MATYGLRSREFVEQIGQLDSRPKCGARTRRGMPCKRAAVRGVGRCPLHGGGAAMKKRYEAELLKSKPGKRREWLLDRLARTAQNRVRSFDKGHKPTVDQTALAFNEALKVGRTTLEARNRWVRAVEAVRPYLLDGSMPLIHEAAMGELGHPLMAATLMAGHLSLNENEIAEFRSLLGLPC